MRILKSVFVFIVAIVFITGCATIMHGSKQDIFVSSSPEGAIVKVSGNTITTPGFIKLDRKNPMYILQFEKEGYEPVKVKLIQTTDGWIWGNILVGGLIGLVIDYSNGSAYKLSPEKVEVTLKKLGQLSLNNKDTDLLVFVDKDKLDQY